VSHLKIEIPSKNLREKPTNATIKGLSNIFKICQDQDGVTKSLIT
jgi:hypothetical protein